MAQDNANGDSLTPAPPLTSTPALMHRFSMPHDDCQRGRSTLCGLSLIPCFRHGGDNGGANANGRWNSKDIDLSTYCSNRQTDKQIAREREEGRGAL